MSEQSIRQLSRKLFVGAVLFFMGSGGYLVWLIPEELGNYARLGFSATLIIVGLIMMLDLKMKFGFEIKNDLKDKHNQENNQDFTKEVPL